MQDSVGIVSADKRFIENATGTLVGLGYKVEAFEEVDAARVHLTEGNNKITLFDESFDKINDSDLMEIAAQNQANIICTDGDEADTIRILVQYPNVYHVFGKNKPYYDVELATALKKISGEIGSIERYLQPGTLVQKIEITEYQQRDDYLSKVQKFAEELNCFPDFPAMVSTVTWELIMNAMFDAPIDRVTGKPKYAHSERTGSLKVDPGEEVCLAFGADEQSFVVSVTDNFGRLTRDVVVNHLEHCSRQDQNQIRSGRSGAGVGLYLLFNSISQINFNIEPGSRTEVIFVVFLSRRRKDFVLRARSVNFFIGAS